LLCSPAAATIRRVKPGITLKLFLAILAACALAAVAMAVATRLSFQSGFLGYLDQADGQRLDTLTARLADEYRKRGSWDFIRNDYRQLREMAIPDQPVQRLTLLDASRRVVAGNPEMPEDTSVRSVVVGDQVVGWVARAPFRRLTGAADVAFQQEQLRAAWVIAALAVVLAAVVAVVLARAFLLPVKRLAEATHRLAAGAYDTRVAVRSGDEIGRLGDDFNCLALALERNEQLRRRFIADVSHELRTPLAIARGEIEAIEDGVRPLSRESIGSLKNEVQALGKLVEDLYQLSLADVGALAYRKEPVDVAEVAREAVDAFGERLREHGLKVDAQLAPAKVFGDGDRLAQAFRNLLENSLRYTDAGGTLRIGVKRDAGRVAVEFEDSAPGVAAQAMPHLFERFFRAEGSRNRAHGGAGLGLAIVRSIVEAHGGEIVARASQLGGLSVLIALPELTG
jgi:two-component system, OmpR family, sensor histidine kinase BaeS